MKLTIHHWHQYLRGAYPWDYSVSYSAARDAELAVAPGSGFSGLEAVLYDVAARHVDLLKRQTLRRRAAAHIAAGAAADAPAMQRLRLSFEAAAMTVLVMHVLSTLGGRRHL